MKQQIENVSSKMLEHLKIQDGTGKEIINRKEKNSSNTVASMLDATSRLKGFFKIYDKDTGEIIVDKTNAIHYENMSYALAGSLMSGSSTYTISTMGFGNGGCVVNGTGDITYLPPNVTGTNATLYNQTYQQSIQSSNILHLNGKTYTDIVMTTTLSYGSVTTQSAFDNGTTFDNNTFSEIGLVSSSGLLLTHCVFSPIQKSTNRSFVITYTLRISMV